MRVVTMMDLPAHKIHEKPVNRCTMEIKQQTKLPQLGCEPIFPVENVSFRPSIFILIFTQSKAPSETSKTEYGSVQDQEDKVPENFSDEEISDASSNDKP